MNLGNSLFHARKNAVFHKKRNLIVTKIHFYLAKIQLLWIFPPYACNRKPKAELLSNLSKNT